MECNYNDPTEVFNIKQEYEEDECQDFFYFETENFSHEKNMPTNFAYSRVFRAINENFVKLYPVNKDYCVVIGSNGFYIYKNCIFVKRLHIENLKNSENDYSFFNYKNTHLIFYHYDGDEITVFDMYSNNTEFYNVVDPYCISSHVTYRDTVYVNPDSIRGICVFDFIDSKIICTEYEGDIKFYKMGCDILINLNDLYSIDGYARVYENFRHTDILFLTNYYDDKYNYLHNLADRDIRRVTISDKQTEFNDMEYVCRCGLYETNGAYIYGKLLISLDVNNLTLKF